MTKTRPSDDYISLTDIWANPKQFQEYLAAPATRLFLRQLAADQDLLETDLIDTSFDFSLLIPNDVWVHPCVAIHFACSISPVYAVDTMKWIQRWLNTEMDMFQDDLWNIQLENVQEAAAADTDTVQSCSLL